MLEMRLIAATFVAGFTFGAPALAASAAAVTVPLYSTTKPHPEGMRERADVNLLGDGQAVIRNVIDPSLTLYMPEGGKSRGGASVIIAPGGGFMMLSWESEGTMVARRLAEQGIAAFVLRYRLEQTPEDKQTFADALTLRIKGYMEAKAKGENTPSAFPSKVLAIEDAAASVRLVRESARKWGLDPERVGFIGFSAGGITAASVATGEESGRPDFVGIIYGSLEGPVPNDAPPAFIATSADDPIQTAQMSIDMFRAWKAANRPAELHLFEKGGHGYGLVPKDSSSDHWFEEFVWWMEAGGFLAPRSEKK